MTKKQLIRQKIEGKSQQELLEYAKKTYSWNGDEKTKKIAYREIEKKLGMADLEGYIDFTFHGLTDIINK